MLLFLEEFALHNLSLDEGTRLVLLDAAASSLKYNTSVLRVYWEK